MIAKLRTCAIFGIEACPVDVEVHVKTGQFKFTVIGLGDSAVKEARDRVKLAIRNSGFKVPSVILVNLAPADLKKEGASFDLAIALGVLAAAQQIPNRNFAYQFFFGELALDGGLKPVRGIVALVITAMQAGARTIIVPSANYREASLVKGVEVIPVTSLCECADYLQNGNTPMLPPQDKDLERASEGISIDDVYGQERAKRAMQVAAAGGHNLMMIGPPGCGKSMLAARFATLLPILTEEECLEVVKIHSVAGLPIKKYLSGNRPYRSPHHVVSDVGLIGGGANPRPGEISLAHNGVLFMDEFPEYRRSAIEALRAPMENGQVRITRAAASHSFPARFQLLAAMNPCPCGRLGVSNSSCLCSRSSIATYLKKLSEPILDRIDLHVELDAVPVSVLSSKNETSQAKHSNSMICDARNLQLGRQGVLNAAVEGKLILKSPRVGQAPLKLLQAAAESSGISARSFVKVLRVALTIADLSASETLKEEHVAEALSYRRLDKLKSYCR